MTGVTKEVKAIVWLRPSGSKIELQDCDNLNEYAEKSKWKRADDKDSKKK